MFRLGILLYLIDPELEFGCMMLGVVDNLKLSKVVYFKSWLLVAILCVGMDGSGCDCWWYYRIYSFMCWPCTYSYISNLLMLIISVFYCIELPWPCFLCLLFFR